MGQDQLATAERHEAKALSRSSRVPDFFRIKSRRVIVRQALGQFANQCGLADSRQSGDKNVRYMAGALQKVPAPSYILQNVLFTWSAGLRS
jgi:hypothetical protein